MLALFKLIPLLLPRVNEALPLRVPPFKIMLSASKVPGFAPRLSLEETLIVPDVIVVDPEYVLVPDKVKILELEVDFVSAPVPTNYS